MSDSKSTFGVPPVERAIQLLRYIGEGNSCENTSLAARETGINRTTLLRLLETLKQQRMIESGAGSGFVLGTGLIHLASNALLSRDVVGVAQPQLKKLAISLGLSAHLGVTDSNNILYLARETPNLHLVSNVRVGSRLPIHATTIGRIILAHKTEHERAELLDGVKLVRFSDRTATSHKKLTAQINEDREQGIAWSEGNFEPAIGSAAVAIFDSSQTVIAAINVTGPVGEFAKSAERREEIQLALCGAAKHISDRLGFMPDRNRANTVGVVS